MKSKERGGKERGVRRGERSKEGREGEVRREQEGKGRGRERLEKGGKRKREDMREDIGGWGEEGRKGKVCGAREKGLAARLVQEGR